MVYNLLERRISLWRKKMATLVDKEKICQYLKERPDGATFTNIVEEIQKSQSVTVYMLNTLQKEGKITKQDGVWYLATGSPTPPTGEKPPPPQPAKETGSPMKDAAEPEVTTQEPVPGAYEKFMTICRSVGIQENFLKAMTDHIFMGNIYDLTEVWDNLQGMYLRPDVTKRIFNFWSRVINQPIPDDIIPHVLPSKTESAKEAETKLPTRFTLVGDEIVPDPEGEFTFQQARQVLMTRAIQGAAPGTGSEKVSEIIAAISPFLESQRTARADEVKEQGEQSVLATVVKSLIENKGGNAQQPLTLADMLAVVDKIDEARRSAVAAVSAGMGKQTSGFDELERMINVFDKMKGMFGSHNNGGTSPVTIAIKGENGETGAIPLETFFALEDHKRKVRQEDEELSDKRETGKSIRGFFDKISKAAANFASK